MTKHSNFKTALKRNEDGELERLCTRCGEWWYADRQFFSPGKNGALHSWCKACTAESRKLNYTYLRGPQEFPAIENIPQVQS